MEPVKLGQLLISEGVLTAAQLEAALVEQKRSGGKLGEALLRLQLVDESLLVKMLARQHNLPVAELDGLTQVAPATLAKVPASVAHAQLLLPLELQEAGTVLVLAVTDAPRGARIEELRSLTGCWVVPRLAGRRALESAITRFYGAGPVPRPTPAGRPAAREARALAVPVRSSEPVGASASAAPALRLGSPEAMQAIAELLIEKGVLTREELLAKLSS
jgi:hypothetical protein